MHRADSSVGSASTSRSSSGYAFLSRRFVVAVAFTGLFVAVGAGAQRAPGETPTSAMNAVVPPPPVGEAHPDPTRYLTEPEPPSPVPWVVACVSAVGMLISMSWAFRERGRAKIVAEELSRIRMHRTAPLRVTASLESQKKDQAGA